MKVEEVMVLRDSPEAAQYRTGLSGWVSRAGRYFGDEPHSEDMARYDGCTHVACQYCGSPARKGWLSCLDCRAKRDAEAFASLPEGPFEVGMVYSHTLDRYYQDPDDALDDLEEGQTLRSLDLVLCSPNYADALDVDYFADDLPDGGDPVPDELEVAIQAFNDAMRGVVLSWSPSNVRLALPDSEEQP